MALHGPSSLDTPHAAAPASIKGLEGVDLLSCLESLSSSTLNCLPGGVWGAHVGGDAAGRDGVQSFPPFDVFCSRDALLQAF